MKTKNKLFFVYVDKTDDNQVFYVGKGNAARAAGTQRNNKHSRISRLFGLNREIVWQTSSEAEAFAYEQRLIEFFGTFTTDRSNLTLGCNFTPGGEGSVGYRWTEEQRKIHKTRIASFKDDPEWRAKCAANGRKNVGPKSAAHREKIRMALLGKPCSQESKEKKRAALLGRKRPVEVGRKISAALKARYGRSS